jgi:hypothetical protein
MIGRRINDWWHDGEAEGCRVYHENLFPPIAFLGLIIAGIFTRFRPFPLFVVVGMLIIVAGVFSLRRAIITTADGVWLRPSVGRARLIRFAEIKLVKEARIATGASALSRAGVQGIQVEAGVNSFQFPLTTENAQDLRDQLERAATANSRGR